MNYLRKISDLYIKKISLLSWYSDQELEIAPKLGYFSEDIDNSLDLTFDQVYFTGSSAYLSQSGDETTSGYMYEKEFGMSIPLSEIATEIIEKFNNIGNDMLKQISNVTLPSNYYIQNRKHYRIKAILDGYNFINNEISKSLKQNEEFNPSMLYFSLLALWFKELNKESKSKEYIYFILYPYSNV